MGNSLLAENRPKQRHSLSFDRMETLSPIIDDTSMTLIIGALNQDSIVVGADSLRGHDGRIFFDAKKLYEVNGNCVILVAGYLFDAGRVDQFLIDFIDAIRQNRLTDVENIATQLSQTAVRTINLNGASNINFLMAGFSGAEPKLFCIQSSDNFEKSRHHADYLAAGKDEFANELCRQLGLSNNMATEELELSIHKLLLMTSGEFPDQVGGDMKVEVLTS
jgi:20S proteasome alpha/beta subunit